MRKLHLLPPDVFDELAATGGGPETVELLKRTRHSQTLLAIRQFVDHRPDLLELLTVLAAAQAAAPTRVAAVLTYPWVSVWISRALRDGWTVRDRQHLAAVVTAASLRAQIVEPVPPLLLADGGQIVLPTLGVLTVSGQVPRRLTTTDLRDSGWLRLRTVTNGQCHPRSEIIVDDLDPHRDCHGFSVTGRVDDRTWTIWRDTLRNAGCLLATYAPDRHDEVAVGLSSAVPLQAAAAGADISATHRDAFGGFAASLPRSPAELAATMIHEFQHSKLHAIATLVNLHHGDDQRTYFAPWRPDPRPLVGALHGAYAFTAVAGFWHAMRADPTLEHQATLRFATMRAEVNRVLPDLLAAPGLTQSGQRFVASLATAAGRLCRHNVPRKVERHAARRLHQLERQWRQRWGPSA